MLMVGDIGGTKTELAVYSSITTLSVPVADAIFPSAQYQSLEEIVQSFQKQFDVPVDRACFGIAGPVFVNCSCAHHELTLYRAIN